LNKIILMGRLVKDVEVRYTNSSEPLTVARYTLAVKRNFKTNNQPDVDFFNCIAFGKIGDFAEKYLQKGLLISIVGRLQNRSYTDKEGNKKNVSEIIVEEHYFTGDKKNNNTESSTNNYNNDDDIFSW
jgi:single-strand DNA-binding protein